MFSNGGQFRLGSNQKKQCELSFYCAVYDAAVLKKPVFQAGIISIFVWGNWAENRLKSFQLVVCNLRVCKCFSFTGPKKCEPTRECNKDVNQAQSSEGVWLGKGSENDA